MSKAMTHRVSRLKLEDRHCFFLNSSMKVKMHYDQTFKSVFGGDSVNTLRRVVAQAQNIYYWPTLPTTVNINVVDEMEIPYSINADQPTMYDQ